MRIIFFLSFAIQAIATGTELQQATAELKAITANIPSFQIITFNTNATSVTLNTTQSLTIEDLRNMDLDDNPPSTNEPATPYVHPFDDQFPYGEGPYVATDIKPFRFQYFNCVINYGHWHTYDMVDYVGSHGFNILCPYVRTLEQGAHLPANTEWLKSGGYVNWDDWLPDHGIAKGRYDQLVSLDLVQMHLDDNLLKRVIPPEKLSDTSSLLMIDMEHEILSTNSLREQTWYPTTGTPAEKADFEDKYYAGYTATYTSVLATAAIQGWTNLSVYGWEPYARTWSNLDEPEVDPATDFAWQTYGKDIYNSVDIINNSVYCFYWSPRNVAYILANIDSTMKLVNSTENPKPVCPYFWDLLHGGGDGWRWWKSQPIADEEQRAMTAISFFTGIDGFVLWNASLITSHHQPPELLPDVDVMLNSSFELVSDSGAETNLFEKYDAIHVTTNEAELIRFQLILKNQHSNNYGVGTNYPAYSLSNNLLRAHVRVKSHPVAAVVEGLAMAKQFEYLLSHGEVKIDVSARDQFNQNLPIIRRVQLGPYHIIATYDPDVIYGGTPRTIILTNFNQYTNLTLSLPADEQVRFFLLKESSADKAINIRKPLSSDVANILLYHFDIHDSPIAGQTPDASENGYHGSMVGSTYPMITDGPFGFNNALSFPTGDTGYINITDPGVNSLLDCTTNTAPDGFTLGAWVRFDQTNTSADLLYLLDKIQPTANGGPGGFRANFYKYATGALHYYITEQDSANVLKSSRTDNLQLTTNIWYHFATTVENKAGGKIVHFLNGVNIYEGTLPEPISDSSGALQIGARVFGDDGNQYFSIDELFIANGIHKIINEPSSHAIDINFPVSNEVADIVLWHFDSTNDPSAGYTPDASTPNYQNGTLIAGAVTEMPQLITGPAEATTGHSKFNHALSFNKGTNLVARGPSVRKTDPGISNSDILRLSTNEVTSGFTIGAWIRIDSYTPGVSEWSQVIDKHSTDGGGYAITFNKDANDEFVLGFTVYSGSTNALWTGVLPDFGDGNWHHIGLSYENSTNGIATFWYNGANNHSEIVVGPIESPTSGIRNFVVGESNVSSYGKFIGSIDELFIARGIHTFYKSEIPPKSMLLLIR